MRAFCVCVYIELLSILLFLQTREEGKSLLHEILKLKGVLDSSTKQGGMEDLSAIDLDQAISPIT